VPNRPGDTLTVWLTHSSAIAASAVGSSCASTLGRCAGAIRSRPRIAGEMSDDEVTREVDPNWLARLRSEATNNEHDNDHDDEHDNEHDNEHTIGNADLLDQVRAAVRDAHSERTPSTPPTPPARSTSSTRSTRSTGSGPSTPSGAAEVSFPPPDPTSPAHSAKAAPTLTFPEARWQPPPRLKPITPATPALLVDTTRPRPSRRALVIVVAATVIAALVVGVVIGRSGSSDREPGDETVVTTPGGGTSASTVETELGS